MKTVEELNKRKVPIVAIDPSLEKDKGKVFFPEKLQKADEMGKRTKLPPNKNSHLEAVNSDKSKSKD